MSKQIIYLYGGPGTGKSTTAAGLFRIAKQNDINAELVREYIKDWVWEGRNLVPGDGTYIATNQTRLERILFERVNLIVSDSPPLIAAYYALNNPLAYKAVMAITEEHNALVQKAGFTVNHIFLERTKVFNPAGRWHNEQEAKQIDSEMRRMLVDLGIPVQQFTANVAAAQMIFDLVISPEFLK